MDENLYNYDSMYGGLAAKSYNPYTPTYRPALSATRPAALGTNLTSTPGVELPGGVDTPGRGWMANAQALGTLGLGLASFLDQRKTADLQRKAMRQNLDVAREHQASRKVLGESWNKAWGQ